MGPNEKPLLDFRCCSLRRLRDELPGWAQAPANPQASVAALQDPLLKGFLDPPNGARPRVWWHWMNGNISRRESSSIWNGCTAWAWAG